MTSHAAVVARGMGKTCVGRQALEIDYGQQQFTVNGTVVTKGDWITVMVLRAGFFWTSSHRAAHAAC